MVRITKCRCRVFWNSGARAYPASFGGILFRAIEFVPRFSLKTKGSYKSGADPVCQACSHCRRVPWFFFVFVDLCGSLLNAKKNFKENLWEPDSIAEMTFISVLHHFDTGISARLGSLVVM